MQSTNAHLCINVMFFYYKVLHYQECNAPRLYRKDGKRLTPETGYFSFYYVAYFVAHAVNINFQILSIT